MLFFQRGPKSMSSRFNYVSAGKWRNHDIHWYNHDIHWYNMIPICTMSFQWSQKTPHFCGLKQTSSLWFDSMGTKRFHLPSTDGYWKSLKFKPYALLTICNMIIWYDIYHTKLTRNFPIPLCASARAGQLWHLNFWFFFSSPGKNMALLRGLTATPKLFVSNWSHTAASSTHRWKKSQLLHRERILTITF